MMGTCQSSAPRQRAVTIPEGWEDAAVPAHPCPTWPRKQARVLPTTNKKKQSVELAACLTRAVYCAACGWTARHLGVSSADKACQS